MSATDEITRLRRAERDLENRIRGFEHAQPTEANLSALAQYRSEYMAARARRQRLQREATS